MSYIKQYMKLQFLGTGNAFSQSGDKPSCTLISYQKYNILLDCGPSILQALYENKIQPSEITHIYISHLHPDHYIGLAFLYLDNFYITKRKSKIIIYCPLQTKSKLQSLIDLLYDNDEIDTTLLNDIYDFVEIDNEASINTSFGIMKTIPSKHLDDSRIVILTIDNHTIGYSGDTEFDSNLTQLLLDNCNLIIHEATTFDKKIIGHTNLKELLTLEPNNDQLIFITHHDDTVISEFNEYNTNPNFILVKDNFIFEIE